MKHIRIFLYLTFLVTFNNYAQQPHVNWSKTFGGSNDDIGNFIIQTFDGGYVVVGASESVDGDFDENQGGLDSWILKLDVTGDTLWTKNIGRPGSDEARFVLQAADGGYLISGFSKIAWWIPETYWVLKLNNTGTILWAKTIEDFLIKSIIESSDSGYVLAGKDLLLNSAKVVKLNNDGYIAWEKEFESQYDIAHSIYQSPDSSYTVIGGHKIWRAKLNKNGILLGIMFFTEQKFTDASQIIESLDSGFVVVNSKRDMYTDNSMIKKLDKQGEIEWSVNAFNAAYDRSVSSIFQLADSSYIIGGRMNCKIAIAKLDKDGYYSWIKPFHHNGFTYDQAFSIAQTIDSGFILAGYTTSSETSNLFPKYVCDNYYNYSRCKDLCIIQLKHNPVCPAPEVINSIYVTNESAKITWSKRDSEEQWEIIVDTVGFDIKSTTPVSVGENNYTWYNLMADTKYYCYVRVKCTDEIYSNWSGPFVFKTLEPSLYLSLTSGGTGKDVARSIKQTTDGGYVVVGSSESNDGDVHNANGKEDFWVVKMNSINDTMWTKTFGGSNDEIAYSVCKTDDGGYIIAGNSSSIDGYVHGNKGGKDCWIIKLDMNGDTIWTKTLGGSKDETVYSICQASDGGYICAGNSNSIDGDMIGNNGKDDFWIFKLSKVGDVIWSKLLGGTEDETAKSIVRTSDGGYIVAGSSNSVDGFVHNNFGEKDYWIVKLDNNGDTLWTKTIGGIKYEYANSIIQTSDEGYAVAGFRIIEFASTAGDGISEFFIVKLDKKGDFMWTKSFKFWHNWDQANSIIQMPDDGFVVVGSGYTNPWPCHPKDLYIVGLDKNGTIIWKEILGHPLSEQNFTERDFAFSVDRTYDGGYLVAGHAAKILGDIPYNRGGGDYWVIKGNPLGENYLGWFVNSNLSIGTSGHTDVALGDMDGDGDLDAVITKDGVGEANKVWLNDGSGNFTDSGLSFGTSKSWGIALGDLDGDGDLDGFVANIGANKVYLNSGNTTTDNGQNLGTASSRDAALADIDGDGDLDAVVANNANGQANKIWLNDGNGYFTAFTKNFGNDISWGVALGDLDGDGDIDGFIANDGPNKVYLNKGYTTTSNGQNLGNASSRRVQLGDMKGDGDLDAVVANDGAGEPNKVWLNNGKGKFIDSGLNFGTSISMDIALGDLDGDGDLDGFVANDGPNNIYLNDGINTTDNGQSLGNNNSYGVALGDLDGDGDLDAFVANYDGPCKVWINQSPPQTDKLAVAQNSTSNTLSRFSATDSEWEKEIILENYPNPFSRTTTIRFKTNTTTRVVLHVTSLYGTVVEQLFDASVQAEQEYTLEFQSKDLPAGIYLIQLETETDLKAHSRMMLVK